MCTIVLININMWVWLTWMDSRKIIKIFGKSKGTLAHDFWVTGKNVIR